MVESYVTRRKQYINFEINDGNGKTELLEIICGVPKGSILGPLLFMIYINDFCQVSDILKQSCLQMAQTYFVCAMIKRLFFKYKFGTSEHF